MDRAVPSNDNGDGHGSGDGDGDGGGDGDHFLFKSTLCHISVSSSLRTAISTFICLHRLLLCNNRRRHVVTDEMTRASLGWVRSFSSKLRQVCGPNAGWLTVPYNGSSDQDYTYGSFLTTGCGSS